MLRSLVGSEMCIRDRSKGGSVLNKDTVRLSCWLRLWSFLANFAPNVKKDDNSDVDQACNEDSLWRNAQSWCILSEEAEIVSCGTRFWGCAGLSTLLSGSSSNCVTCGISSRSLSLHRVFGILFILLSPCTLR
eukprot:TRINITY_DN957_c0_g1_i5.p1 TRINITY_DN957_c0_g1~~TRINITY_DN957_c0_g1_i5.p1  ORF type:complete len:133 (+),score=7.10 TRINITY_DN957_c0_g1_i5:92-490(+)